MLGVLPFVLGMTACSKKEALPEPPASVRALDDHCENIVSATMTSTLELETEVRVKGLSLWRMCPCHRPSCNVVGSDAEGALVQSNDVFFGFWDASPSLSANELAARAIYVVDDAKTLPCITERTLTFVTSHAPSNGLACDRYAFRAEV